MVCIEGQERLNIGLGIFLTSKDSTDCVGARNSSGLPLKTGTCHIFEFDDVVLRILQRKDLINGVICGHNAVSTGLPRHEVLNLLSNIIDNDLILWYGFWRIDFTAFPILFHQLNAYMLEHIKDWFFPGFKDRGIEGFSDI